MTGTGQPDPAPDQAKRLTQAIREAIISHDAGAAQWYADDLVIDCDAEEFWQVTEQALREALR